jgi:hypothetical protein
MDSAIFSRIRVMIAVLVAIVFIPFVYFTVTATDVSHIELAVPYVPQVFDGNWVAPWDESCEEASAVMVDAFYAKRKSVPVDEAKQSILNMVDWEKRTFGNYEDTTALETVRLFEEFTNARPSIARTPTLDDIRHQLIDGRPVIAFVHMYDLYGERDLRDAFHVFVITGFDDEAREFIVNDPARSQKRYGYDTLMNALHDYDPATREPTGEPTVLFTAPPVFGGQSFFQWIWSIFGKRA